MAKCPQCGESDFFEITKRMELKDDDGSGLEMRVLDFVAECGCCGFPLLPHDKAYKELQPFINGINSPLWAIQHEKERDDVTGEPLYWSNKLGWVTGTDATYFTDEEASKYNLPTGGNWYRM